MKLLFLQLFLQKYTYLHRIVRLKYTYIYSQEGDLVYKRFLIHIHPSILFPITLSYFIFTCFLHAIYYLYALSLFTILLFYFITSSCLCLYLFSAGLVSFYLFTKPFLYLTLLSASLLYPLSSLPLLFLLNSLFYPRLIYPIFLCVSTFLFSFILFSFSLHSFLITFPLQSSISSFHTRSILSFASFPNSLNHGFTLIHSPT